MTWWIVGIIAAFSLGAWLGTIGERAFWTAATTSDVSQLNNDNSEKK